MSNNFEAYYFISDSQLCGNSQENSTLLGLNEVGKLWTGTKCSMSFNIFVSVLFYEYFMVKKSLVCACQIRKVSRICHLAKKIRKSIRNHYQGENRKMSSRNKSQTLENVSSSQIYILTQQKNVLLLLHITEA